MKIRDLKRHLLVEMLKAQRKAGFDRFIEPKEVADAAGLKYEAGTIRLCIIDFENEGLIREAFTLGGGTDGGLTCTLTAHGVEEAEVIEDELAGDEMPRRDDHTPSTAITVEDIATALLAELYVAVDTTEDGRVFRDQFYEAPLGSRVGKKRIDLALDSLLARKLATTIASFPLFFEITLAGFEYVEAHSEELQDAILRPAISGLAPLIRSGSRAASVPASDRIVRIDHNSTEFRQLRDGVASTGELLRGANDLTDDDLVIAARLRAALELMEAPLVNTELLERMLVSSLRYLAEKFADNAIGMAAGAALTLAIQFFGFG